MKIAWLWLESPLEALSGLSTAGSSAVAGSTVVGGVTLMSTSIVVPMARVRLRPASLSVRTTRAGVPLGVTVVGTAADGEVELAVGATAVVEPAEDDGVAVATAKAPLLPPTGPRPLEHPAAATPTTNALASTQPVRAAITRREVEPCQGLFNSALLGRQGNREHGSSVEPIRSV